MSRLVLGALLVAASSATGHAAESGGALLQRRGHHPLNAIFGLPTVASRPLASSEWQVSLEHANNFAGGASGEEILFLDGETTELSLSHRRPLGACWQAEATLPFVAHGGGWADRAIDDWHRAWGLPDADRGLFPDFELHYVWRDAAGRRRELERATSGLGDVRLAVQRTLGCEGARDGSRRSPSAGAIARVGIKLPSGDPDALLGSGATDLYADLQSPLWSPAPRWRLGAALGVLVPGRSDLIARQSAVVGYGTIGGAYRLHPRWQALVQLDAHTPFEDSALVELGTVAASLGVGVRYLPRRGGRVEFSIGEDAVVDTAPDIVARLAWTWRTGAIEPARPPVPPP